MRGARISAQSEEHVFDLGRGSPLTEVEGHQQDVGENGGEAKGSNIEQAFEWQLLEIEQLFELALEGLDSGLAKGKDLTDAGVLVEPSPLDPFRGVFF